MCIMRMWSSVTLPLDKDGGQSLVCVCVYIYIMHIYVHICTSRWVKNQVLKHLLV